VIKSSVGVKDVFFVGLQVANCITDCLEWNYH